MVKFDVGKLRPKLDLEGKYVDFSLIRAGLSVPTLIKDLELPLTNPDKDGECRGRCPKCSKDRAFAVNINTNRFNCFNTNCLFKGGGVIDFTAKLYEVPAKEASHLIACAYGIVPYIAEDNGAGGGTTKKTRRQGREVSVKKDQTLKIPSPVSREEFDQLNDKVTTISKLVWSLLFDSGQIDKSDQLFDDESEYELEDGLSV